MMATPNKSMDVRAKQRLCYRVVRCLLRWRWRFRPTSSQPLGVFWFGLNAKLSDENQGTSRKNKLARRQTACLRIMTRPTNQWTRGETALLLKLACETRSCAYSVSPASSQPFDRLRLAKANLLFDWFCKPNIALVRFRDFCTIFPLNFDRFAYFGGNGIAQLEP